MKGFIVFVVGTNRYALNIENVQRIIQAVALTEIPNTHPYIDGMMSYENDIIKVFNFRKLIDLKSYDEELRILFSSLKVAHEEWVLSLKRSLYEDCEFTKTLDPHICGLGKWIDEFTAFDDNVVSILNNLTQYHKQLHNIGGVALDIYKKDKQKAIEIFETEISDIYKHTMGYLDKFIVELDMVSNSLQKFIIYDLNGESFALKVDDIEDIVHIQDDKLINSHHETKESEYLELDGVLDMNDYLVNIIKKINLPK
jgi:chemotaxis signal transduction protein